MDKISDNGEITKASTGRSDEELPNVMFVQLESFFDPTEVEWLRFSEDPIPNLRKLFNEYSSGYFKVPSVGAGTANTEYEVLTGMSMRFFGPGRVSVQDICQVQSDGERGFGAEESRVRGRGAPQQTAVISTAVRKCSTTWDLTITQARNS